MKKSFILGIGLVFLIGILVPLSEASRDIYHSYLLSEGKKKERRYSSRIAPFNYKGRSRKSQKTFSPYPHYRGQVRFPEKVAVKRRPEFNNKKAQKIPFYFSLPKGFRRVEDTLDWSSGTLESQKGTSVFKVIATDYRCEGGSNYKKYCLKQAAEELFNVLKKEFPGMSVREKKAISLRTLDPIQPNKRKLGWYIKLQNREETVSQLVLLEPTHEFLWTVGIKSQNNPEGILNDKYSTQKIINSLFAKPEFIIASRRVAARKIAKPREVSYRRSSSHRIPVYLTSSYRSDVKISADQIPFEMQAPRGFEKIIDTLEYDSGEIVLKDNKNSTIRIVATNQKCEGNTQSRDSYERRSIQECINNQGKLSTEDLRSKTDIQILHDESTIARTTIEQRVYQEAGHFFMAVEDKSKRHAQFTFRDPRDYNIWRIEMEMPERGMGFLKETPMVKKVISSLFFKK